MKTKPFVKSIERKLYIEVENNEAGQKILEELVKVLTTFKDNPAYLNGWIGPVSK